MFSHTAEEAVAKLHIVRAVEALLRIGFGALGDCEVDTKATSWRVSPPALL